MDLNDLIGYEMSEAKQLLKNEGFENIDIIINSKENEKCNKTLVCSVRQTDNHITLICGQFYII